MDKFPLSSQLILQGGDERIMLLPETACNKYGVRPWPQLMHVEFSSSTASHVSADAYDAIEKFRQRVDVELQRSPPFEVWGREKRRIGDAFLNIWELDQKTVYWKMTRSGSDAHFAASALAFRKFGRPFKIVMAGFNETGSNVPQTLLEGASQHGGTGAELVEISVRNPDGSCRSPKSIDQDFYDAVIASLNDELPVLVIRLDESKSGGVLPSLELLAMLRKKSPENVAVLVDASQLRCTPAQLQSYISAGFIVAVTGSKYFGAPTFCGALLAGPEWQTWWTEDVDDTDEKGLPNFGLLARWEAALFCMRHYFNIPAAKRDAVISSFEAAIQYAVGKVESIKLLDCQREDLHDPRSLFAFRLERGHPARCLTPEEVRIVYDNLIRRRQPNGHIYTLGQPVACGSQTSQPTQYLRLSLSATMLIDICQLPKDKSDNWLQNEILAALHALDDELMRLP